MLLTAIALIGLATTTLSRPLETSGPQADLSGNQEGLTVAHVTTMTAPLSPKLTATGTIVENIGTSAEDVVTIIAVTTASPPSYDIAPTDRPSSSIRPAWTPPASSDLDRRQFTTTFLGCLGYCKANYDVYNLIHHISPESCAVPRQKCFDLCFSAYPAASKADLEGFERENAVAIDDSEST